MVLKLKPRLHRYLNFKAKTVVQVFRTETVITNTHRHDNDVGVCFFFLMNTEG